MPVNSTHPDNDENLDAWLRIRDVLAGDRAIKRAGEKYVARLDSQTDEEFNLPTPTARVRGWNVDNGSLESRRSSVENGPPRAL